MCVVNVGYPWVTRCLSFEATINCVVELSAIEGYYKSDYILAAKAFVICWISFLSIIGEVKTVRSQSCHNLIKSPPPDLRCRSCYTTDDISSLSETRLLVFYSTSQGIVLHPTSLCRCYELVLNWDIKRLQFKGIRVMVKWKTLFRHLYKAFFTRSHCEKLQ